MEQVSERLREARALRAGGQYCAAIALLEALPDDFEAPPETRIAIYKELQAAQLAEAESTSDANVRLAMVFRAQRSFYLATYVNPTEHEAYRAQARGWALLGRGDMACNLLRSLQAFQPDSETAALLRVLDPTPPGKPLVSAPPPPRNPRRPRILVLVIPGYDPGMDVVYDGLCRVLGKDHVEEYPYKPLLHGASGELACNYPTTFSHGGEPRDLDWVTGRLRDGYFDLVLHADLIKTIPLEDLGRILQAAGDTPLMLVDGWDDLSNMQPVMAIHFENAMEAAGAPRESAPPIHLVFKRELLTGFDYGGNTVPFSLAYATNRAPLDPPIQREHAVFWAGKRFWGNRRIYLEVLEAMFSTQLREEYSQEEYMAALSTAYMGVSLYGFGFDTIRYWEVAAHGMLLVAHRPPITLANDYEEGEQALFFDDLEGMQARFREAMAQPERIVAMARAGRAHCLRHHTGEARARELLAHVHAHLWPGECV